MSKIFILFFFIFIHSFANANTENEKKFIDTLNTSIDFLGLEKGVINQTKQLITTHSEDNKFLTIFYFVDSSVTNVMLKNFSNYISKLKKHNPKIMGKVMLRGLINDDFKFSANFFDSITRKENITNLEYYPIHFNSFKYFKLERVPAYALSNCSSENFSFNECEHEYLIRGDISLLSFFEILSQENNKFNKNYHQLLGD